MSNIVKINNKYYDFGTKNGSFLLTAQELKTLGIKNWYFFLEVKNPHLGVQDINPHDPNLSAEDIGKVLIECKQNPWYFFRETALVPVRGAGKFPLILTRASAALIWCFMHSIDVILCQPRQTHKTTWDTALVEYGMIFEYQNVEIPYMHVRQDRCLENVELLRDYICALPNYMNPWYGRNKLPGTKSLKYEEHNTSITVLSSADSEVKAKDKMRGMTVFMAFLDEWEYIPYISSVMEGAMPAIISAREIMRKTGGRTCIIYASTPGDLETDTGKEAQRIIDMTPRFSEQFYDFTEEEIAEYFNGINNENGESISTLYIEFNRQQLRKDDRWEKEQHKEAVRNNKLAEYRRGVLLQRFRGGDTVLFEQQDIDYIIEHVRQPDHEIFILKKFHLYIYNHHVESIDITSETPYFDINLPYLIGIDIAAGGDGDNTAIIVVNPYTLEICAELQSPYIGVIDLMRIITVLAKLIPNGLFCPETNSIGKAIVEFVQESKLEHRFYHDPKLDISKNAITMKDPTVALKVKADNKGYIGTYVTPKVREEMFKLLLRYVKDYRNLINSKYLVSDITNLVKQKNGKIAAANGEHDDMVMAYNHVLYVLTFGYDLTRFGIDKRKCTFEQVRDIIKEYSDNIEEESVNNMIPYDHPTLYEEQALHDLTSPGQGLFVDGVDRYGYSYDDYNKQNQLQPTQANDPLTSSDLSFFTSVNVFY